MRIQMVVSSNLPHCAAPLSNRFGSLLKNSFDTFLLQNDQSGEEQIAGFQRHEPSSKNHGIGQKMCRMQFFQALPSRDGQDQNIQSKMNQLQHLDCVQFYCSVSKAIWTEYIRLKHAMVICDAL